jgi:hypothetical protein
MKFLHLQKIRRIYKSLRLQKIRWTIESLRALKSRRLVKNPRLKRKSAGLEKQVARLLFRLGGISNC